MFATPAYAQVAGAATGGNSMMDALLQFSFIPLMLIVAYFLLFRPQQQRAKQQQEKLGGIKRGDTVVLNSGVIGLVARVDDNELTVEIAKGVEVKVVKAMVADVRTKGAPVAANDAKK
jgi:preprotein translocase subunit YajC